MDVEVQANAKINLALDVLGERADGYHEIDSIMQEIDLHDTLSVEKGRGGFVFFCDDSNLKLDESNLVYKAWDLLRDRVDPEDQSVVVELEKAIPMAAGLGGGSSDAAAMLRALNDLWELDLEDAELESLGLELGSDVPFFIRGGTQRVRGRGEVLTPLDRWDGKLVLLVNPGEAISTQYVYDRIRPNGKLRISELVSLLAVDSPQAYAMMGNHMETVTLKALPKLAQIKEELVAAGAELSLMSGSGATIFGIFSDEEKAKAAEQKCRLKYPFVHLSSTL